MNQPWYEQYFRCVDSMKMDDVVAFFADDIELVFGNGPSVKGRDQVRTLLSGFWKSIVGIKHQVSHVFEDHDHLIVEATVTYTLPTDMVISVPCATVMRVVDGLMKDLRIYIDLSLLYAVK